MKCFTRITLRSVLCPQNCAVCIVVTLYSCRYRNASTALPQDIAPYALMSSSSGNYLRVTKFVEQYENMVVPIMGKM